ncbi:MAG: isochorismate synthase [Actinomycetota bacterium]|nr:isochorismate synthase [Actinomycetota bacterium]
MTANATPGGTLLPATLDRPSPAGSAPLVAASVPVGDAAVAAVRRLARRAGRLVEGDSFALLGCGVAAHLELPDGLGAPGAATEASRLLAELGPSAIAVGALPFDPSAPGRLTVPVVTVTMGTATAAPRLVVVASPATAELLAARLAGCSPGPELERLLAEIAGSEVAGSEDDGAGATREGAAGDAGTPPDGFELSSARPHADFSRRVAGAVAAIRAGWGGLEKVVLAREVSIVANRPLRQHDLVERLRALHPSCATFAVDGFVGASPELLCARSGDAVRSVPLAGTVARSGDPDEDDRLADGLRSSGKDRAEHAVVVRAILADLGTYCHELAASDEPTLVELRNVSHLASTISGRLVAPASALELAATLHPTPAVGGWPREAALAYLAAHEGIDRDRYAGPVGYLEGSGDGAFWVGIRSALVEGTRARLLAGVGIVDGSDPAAELAETQLKLQALLAAAVRP